MRHVSLIVLVTVIVLAQHPDWVTTYMIVGAVWTLHLLRDGGVLRQVIVESRANTPPPAGGVLLLCCYFLLLWPVDMVRAYWIWSGRR